MPYSSPRALAVLPRISRFSSDCRRVILTGRIVPLYELSPKDKETIKRTAETTMGADILRILSKADKATAREISRRLGKLYPHVSSTLNAMRRAGILISERRGKEAYYALREDLKELVRALIETNTLRVSLEIAEVIAKREEEGVKNIREDPTLTPEEREIVVERFIKKFREGISRLSSRLWREAIEYAKRGSGR